MIATKSFRISKAKKKEKYERVQVTQSFQTVLQRTASPTDQGKMLMFLRREFPMAFERFMMDNGGRLPHIPISFPLYSSLSGLDGECKDAEPKDTITIETEAAISSLMCTMPVMTSRDIPPENVTKAVATDIWTLLSGIFCFSGSTHYMPDDSEYIEFDGNMSDSDMPSAVAAPVVTTKKPKSLASRLNPMKILGPLTAPLTSSPSFIAARNPLLFQRRATDYQNNRELLAQDLSDEAIRILKLYVGLSRETGVSFNWAMKISKNNIFVHNSDIPGSSFSALKSDCAVKKDKYTILRYLTDDERSKEYDETLEGYKVRHVPTHHSNRQCILFSLSKSLLFFFRSQIIVCFVSYLITSHMIIAPIFYPNSYFVFTFL